ncbi:hypothetical protein K8T06_02875, partial [bacterium]|nr:hypothetical protein [bacterium]
LSWNRYLYCRNDPVNYFDPDGRLTIVLIPYQEVVGEIKLVKHASVYVDSDNRRLYDPSGGFNSSNRASDDSLYSDNANISEYIKFHEQDGDKVAVFVFDTTPEEEAQIGENADIVGGAATFTCAISVGNVLQGIGPFENLGATLTPAMLFRALVGLQKYGMLKWHANYLL